MPNNQNNPKISGGLPRNEPPRGVARGETPRKPMQREISAGLVVFRRTKEGPVFLILYNGGDYWNFPKGKIENEERSFEAAVRETGEETGLKIEDLRPLRNFRTEERFVFRRNSRTISKLIIFYVAESKKAVIRLAEKTHGERHQGYGWFSYREATRILGKYRESQRVLKEAYDFICGKGNRHGRENSGRPNPHLQGGRPESRESGGVPRGGQRPA